MRSPSGRSPSWCTLHGAIHSFSVPAAYGLLPRFVARERLASAIAVNSAYTQAAILVGPALAGWVILHYGSAVAFAINVAGYVVFLISAAFLRTPADYQQPPRSDRSVLGDFVDGARYIFGHHGITTLLVLMLLGDVLAVSLFHMLPAFSTGTLGLGIEGMTTILAVYGAGATLAALWLAHGGSQRISSTLVLRAYVIYACAIGALVLMGNLWLAAGAALLWGIAGQIRSTGTIALLQTSIPDEQRGRVMGTEFLFSRIAGGIGTYLVGTAAEQHGLQVPMLIAVGVCLVAWVYAYTRRRAIQSSFVDSAGRCDRERSRAVRRALETSSPRAITYADRALESPPPTWGGHGRGQRRVFGGRQSSLASPRPQPATQVERRSGLP